MQTTEAHGLYFRSDLTPEHPTCFLISHLEIPAGLPMSPPKPTKCGAELSCPCSFSKLTSLYVFLIFRSVAPIKANEFYQENLLAPSVFLFTSLYIVKQQIQELPTCPSQPFTLSFIPTGLS